MFLPTPCQFVSHKRFHQCANHKKELSLRHLLTTFDSFSFFQASLWLGVDKVLQKLTKTELKHLFQCCILIPRKCPCKTLFQHTVGGGEFRRPCNGIFFLIRVEISKYFLNVERFNNSFIHFRTGASKQTWDFEPNLW